jgi:transposase
VRFRPKEELPPAEKIETPHDPEARFRHRGGASWVGYIVHLSETCEDDAVHLLTHAMTTAATVHEARCTAAIHGALGSRPSTWWKFEVGPRWPSVRPLWVEV